MEWAEKIFSIVSQWGSGAYWLVFGFSFLESLAFLGTLFPGATLVVFAGFLSSQDILEPGSLIFFVFAGAALGDAFSYWLGLKNKRDFKKGKIFFGSDYLEKGCCFLKKYGPESIFLARFMGPARSIIPFVAGAASLRPRVFLSWNLASVALWAISHVLLGHFFGSSLEVLGAWIKKSNYFFLFAAAFFGFFYFGKKALLYRSQKQFFEKKCFPKK